MTLTSDFTVIKRDGRREKFSLRKLRNSVLKALEAAGIGKYVDDIVAEVLSELLDKNVKEIYSSSLADLVELVLVKRVINDLRFNEALKYYVLARIYNHVLGKGRWRGFDPLDLRFTYQALRVLQSRYLIKDPATLRFRETPKDLLRRVAEHVASVEKEGEREFWREEFFRLMADLKFLPNSPTLMNAGTRLGLLSACFVIPVRDSITTNDEDGIMDSLRAQAIIQQSGGGTGFDFSELRPEGDVVASTSGVASGPLSFMKLFDVNTEVIKQGGKRRGANMGILHVWHPDVEKFIRSKSGELKDVHLQNFNISVGVYDAFMEAVLKDIEWRLINPRKTSLDGSTDSRKYAVVRARHYLSEEWVQEVILRELEARGGSVPLEESVIVTWDEAVVIAEREGAVTKAVKAADLFTQIVKSAWEGGDPGLIFIDTINRRHPTWYLGKISATNPCGEEPLLEWESCNLGSINLEKYVVIRNGEPVVDWEGLARDVRVAVRFLDNVIDVARYPLKQLEEAVRRTRKVGLGVMGWAHFLIRLGIKYDSVDALALAYHVAEWIAYNAYLASVDLAKERGAFPAWDRELYRPLWRTATSLEELLAAADVEGEVSDRVLKLIRERPPVSWEHVENEMRRWGLRNATLLSIAPTGTISIIAGTSSSIEPIFALAFTRVVTVGSFIEVNDLFIKELRELGLDEQEVVKAIAEVGTIAENPFMPRRLRNLFRTAHDVRPKWHVLHQAVWQVWVDAGVSKTVNMVAEALARDVREVYLLAWKLGCKGITVYRDRSKSRQVIYFGIKASRKRLEEGKRVEVSKGGSRSSSTSGNKVTEERFRLVSPPVLKDGDIGDCKTCEY